MLRMSLPKELEGKWSFETPCLDISRLGYPTRSLRLRAWLDLS